MDWRSPNGPIIRWSIENREISRLVNPRAGAAVAQRVRGRRRMERQQKERERRQEDRAPDADH